MGGQALYAHHQATTLLESGVSVVLLTCPSFLPDCKKSYRVEPLFPDPNTQRGVVGKLIRLRQLLARYKQLENWIYSNPARILLLDSFSEYFSPFWYRRLGRIQAKGVAIGANLHDPVRDYRVGPKWWHKLSIRCAYRYLCFVLAHDVVPPNASVPSHVEIRVVPHGVFVDASQIIPKAEARKALGLPLDKRVFLSFGFIRDNKNLDLAIQAIAQVEDAFLVIAGRNQSSKDRQIDFYKEHARNLSVGGRVRFVSDFIPEEQVSLYFAASDVVLLTYSQSFHSLSGVLNLAANFRRPVIASSGEGPLMREVQRFKLGLFITPDDPDALVNAMLTHVENIVGDWEGFEISSSWTENILPMRQLLSARNSSLE